MHVVALGWASLGVVAVAVVAGLNRERGPGGEWVSHLVCLVYIFRGDVNESGQESCDGPFAFALPGKSSSGRRARRGMPTLQLRLVCARPPRPIRDILYPPHRTLGSRINGSILVLLNGILYPGDCPARPAQVMLVHERGSRKRGATLG